MSKVLPDLIKYMDSLQARTTQIHKMLGQITPPENPTPTVAAQERLAPETLDLSWSMLISVRSLADPKQSKAGKRPQADREEP